MAEPTILSITLSGDSEKLNLNLKRKNYRLNNDILNLKIQDMAQPSSWIQ